MSKPLNWYLVLSWETLPNSDKRLRSCAATARMDHVIEVLHANGVSDIEYYGPFETGDAAVEASKEILRS